MSRSLHSGCPINKIASWDLDERVRVRLSRTGFDTLQGLSNDCRVKFGIIKALAKCYNSETHVFTFGQGLDNPFTIMFGLEDVLHITGLPIDGKPVLGVDPENGYATCREKLGQSEEMGEKGFIKLDWLKNNFMIVDPSINEDSVEFKYHVRAYVMYVIGCIIAPTGSSTVPVMFLNLLEDIDRIGEYAWGAALLASLYTSLDAFTKRKRISEMISCVYMLMIFAFKRFPTILNIVGGPPTVEEFPLMIPWSNSLNKETRENYHLRDQDTIYEKFQNLESESVIWQPYDINLLPDNLARQVVLGKSRTILFSFEKALYHRPDLCPRQFGLSGPVVLARPLQVFITKKRTGKKVNWLSKYSNIVGEWNSRFNLLIGANQGTSSSEQSEGQAGGMPLEQAIAAQEAAQGEQGKTATDQATTDTSAGTTKRKQTTERSVRGKKAKVVPTDFGSLRVDPDDMDMPEQQPIPEQTDTLHNIDEVFAEIEETPLVRRTMRKARRKVRVTTGANQGTSSSEQSEGQAGGMPLEQAIAAQEAAHGEQGKTATDQATTDTSAGTSTVEAQSVPVETVKQTLTEVFTTFAKETVAGTKRKKTAERFVRGKKAKVVPTEFGSLRDDPLLDYMDMPEQQPIPEHTGTLHNIDEVFAEIEETPLVRRTKRKAGRKVRVTEGSTGDQSDKEPEEVIIVESEQTGSCAGDCDRFLQSTATDKDIPSNALVPMKLMKVPPPSLTERELLGHAWAASGIERKDGDEQHIREPLRTDFSTTGMMRVPDFQWDNWTKSESKSKWLETEAWKQSQELPKDSVEEKEKEVLFEDEPQLSGDRQVLEEELPWWKCCCF